MFKAANLYTIFSKQILAEVQKHPVPYSKFEVNLPQSIQLKELSANVITACL